VNTLGFECARGFDEKLAKIGSGQTQLRHDENGGAHLFSSAGTPPAQFFKPSVWTQPLKIFAVPTWGV
jgi:hypothetical protein